MERELNYVNEYGNISHVNLLKNAVKMLEKFDFKLARDRMKGTTKVEAYYDDPDLSIIKKGNVLRSMKNAEHDNATFFFFYKQYFNKPDKPYDLYKESRSEASESFAAFLHNLGLGIAVEKDPVLNADIKRRSVVLENESARLVIACEHVEYYKTVKLDMWENLIEIADLSMQDEELFCRVNEVLLKELPIRLIKQTKPQRGLEKYNKIKNMSNLLKPSSS